MTSKSVNVSFIVDILFYCFQLGCVYFRYLCKLNFQFSVMEEISAMTSKSSELCFSKEDFTASDFSVDKFVSEYRKHTSLEILKEDLGLFLKVLQSAMVELINKDYADFVNLSTNLVGLDKSIKNLSNPLKEVRDEILNVQKKLEETVSFLQKVLKERDCVHMKKIMLHRVIHVLEGIESIEKQNLEPLNEGSVSCLPTELIERIAVQFNQIQFHMSQSGDVQIIREKQAVKDRILINLLQHLESLFIKSLNDGDEENLYRVLRIYSTIDKVTDIENKFRIRIVRPYMRDIIDEQFISREGIVSMYAQILDFVPQNCTLILKITRGSKKDFQVLKGYDFLVNAVWPEIILCLEYIAPVVFAPGNPKLFHKNYTASMHFVEQFEHLCVVQASVKRLREHPSYNTFMEKWNLLVYFEIRFQEIGSLIENALLLPFEASHNATTSYQLNPTIALWKAVKLCWDSNVYIQPLSHKFWKLTLQLFSRYYYWAKGVVTTHTDSNVAGDEKANLQSIVQLVMLVHDIELTASEMMEFFSKDIAVNFLPESEKLAKGALEELHKLYSALLPDLGSIIVSHVTESCSVHLKQITDIPRLYRKTNREVPSKPSGYINLVFFPLDTFLSDTKDIISVQWQNRWSNDVINNVTEQCLNMTTDVITSVKKMEDSLKRLKKARDKPQGQSVVGAMSDDDKIRWQLHLDVEHFGYQIEKYGVSVKTNMKYKKLEDLVTSAMKSPVNS